MDIDIKIIVILGLKSPLMLYWPKIYEYNCKRNEV